MSYPLKSIATVKKGRLTEDMENGVALLDMEYLRSQGEPRLVSPDNAVFADETDILVLWDGSKAGEFVPSKKGVVGSTLALIKPDKLKVVSRYLYYVCISNQKMLQDLSIGMGIPHVNGEILKTLPIILPEMSFQKKIADYLDEKVAKINASIAKKKQLLNLLEEKRVTVINLAVQDAEGQVKKIKHVAKVNPIGRNKVEDNRVSFVPMEAVSETGDVSLQLRDHNDVSVGYTYFKNDDVVIAKITPCFENGKAAVMKDLKGGYGFGTTEFIVLRPGESVLPEYLYFVIYSKDFRAKGTNEMKGTAGQKRLTESFTANYQFNLPDKALQNKIVSSLKTQLRNIDKAKNMITESVGLLEEFKTSLISNAVTRKVKL